MSKKEFFEIIKEISIAYGSSKFPLNNDVLDVWYKYFRECNHKALTEAMEEYIRKYAFPPAISSLYEIYRVKLKEIQDAEPEPEEELVGDAWWKFGPEENSGS